MILCRPDGDSPETEIESLRGKERVSLVRKAIVEGRYRVDSMVVAMKMFQEAEEL